MLADVLDGRGVNYQITKVTQKEFRELMRNDQVGAFGVIIFHLALGSNFVEENIYGTERFVRNVRGKFPYIRLGIMSGAYDYECLGDKAETSNWELNYKIDLINKIVLGLKPDFYCSYTDDSFDKFVAEQIAKGWLSEGEITWRERERTNILMPKVEFGPETRKERE